MKCIIKGCKRQALAFDDACPECREDINTFKKGKNNMEQHLKTAWEALNKAQLEILHPCETYSQIEDMQCAIQDMIDEKIWEKVA